MNKLIKALAACLVAATGVLTTQASADQCWDSCCEWAVGLDLLYWRPCVCNYEYAQIVQPTVDNVHAQQPAVIKPSNHPGWRLFATRYCDSACTFGAIEWVHVRSTDAGRSNTPIGGQLIVPVPFANVAASAAIAQLRAIYNKINLRLGRVLHRGCALEFYGYAGARLIDINLHRRVETYSSIPPATPTNVWRTKAQYAGFGVELGLGAEYRFECCLGINARLGATATVGQQKFDSNLIGLTQTPGPVNTFYRSQTRCLPGVEARLGLNYLVECDCLSAQFELGYDLEYYHDAVVSLRGLDNLSTGCDPFGFSGPYLSLRLEY